MDESLKDDKRESLLNICELRDVDVKLLEAAEVNDKEGCRGAILGGADPNASRHGLLTAAHIAAERGFAGVLQAVVSAARAVGRRLDLDAVSSFGNTPLVLAARNGRVEAMRILLMHGADPNATSLFSRTPLHVAAFLERGICVRLLLRAGADVNAIDSFYQTPLSLTVLSRAGIEIVRPLLLAGADPNFRNKSSKPLLSLAVLGCTTSEDLTYLVFLLSAGADVKARDKVKLDTALHHAAEIGFLPALDLLVAAGSELQAENAYGETPLNVAIKFGNRRASLHLFYLEEEQEEEELRRLERRRRNPQIFTHLYYTWGNYGMIDRLD